MGFRAGDRSWDEMRVPLWEFVPMEPRVSMLTRRLDPQYASCTVRRAWAALEPFVHSLVESRCLKGIPMLDYQPCYRLYADVNTAVSHASFFRQFQRQCLYGYLNAASKNPYPHDHVVSFHIPDPYPQYHFRKCSTPLSPLLRTRIIKPQPRRTPLQSRPRIQTPAQSPCDSHLQIRAPSMERLARTEGLMSWLGSRSDCFVARPRLGGFGGGSRVGH